MTTHQCSSVSEAVEAIQEDLTRELAQLSTVELDDILEGLVARRALARIATRYTGRKADPDEWSGLIEIVRAEKTRRAAR